MAASSPFQIRTLTEEDTPALLEVDGHAFGSTQDPEVLAEEMAVHEVGRAAGAFDDAQLVGLTAAYSFEIAVPGSVVPAAGVSWVGVLPTHRRRGVLRQLMTFQLHDIHDRGREPVAALYASEPGIYGRFGYGLATTSWRMTVPRDPAALRADAPRDPDLRLRLAPAQDWKVVADTYDALARSLPGMVRRSERWHQHATADHPSLRRGSSELRCVVAEDESGLRGYARYNTKQEWGGGISRGTVFVSELVALDPAARAELYRYLFDLDLMASVDLWNVPADDPVLHWLANPRKAAPVRSDSLYIRLVDLPRALSQRRYATQVDVVLEVRDPLCPWNDGRWRLTGGPEGALCEPTEEPAQLSLGVTELGAVYLGGTSLDELAGAERVQVAPGNDIGTLRAASNAFLSTPRPWCGFMF